MLHDGRPEQWERKKHANCIAIDSAGFALHSSKRKIDLMRQWRVYAHARYPFTRSGKISRLRSYPATRIRPPFFSSSYFIFLLPRNLPMFPSTRFSHENGSFDQKRASLPMKGKKVPITGFQFFDCFIFFL